MDTHKSAPSTSSTSKTKKDEDDDDPSARTVDREKDMAVGGKIGHAQRREMLTKAKGAFAEKFAGGKFL